jgi:hypothetical protein
MAINVEEHVVAELETLCETRHCKLFLINTRTPAGAVRPTASLTWRCGTAPTYTYA